MQPLLEISVLTLNVWGIPLVSSDRETRIAAIATELCTGLYDVVSLQEVWSQKDSQVLQESTAAVLPYAHYFFSGVIGAGLLVLSKYPIIGTLFHAWGVNGYFHRIQHADWFGGKGVGLCKILIGDRVVHLYNAHLHAEYDNENDEYKTHRVIQAFDTAQFIDATRGNSVLQILAGDLNTQPKEISYQVLLYTSKMRDCCQSDSVATNECQRNSYTSKKTLAKNPAGIRIDHIFIRSAEHIEAAVSEYTLPFPEKVPGHKFSFSDHEAVLVHLTLQLRKETYPTCSDITKKEKCDIIASDDSGIPYEIEDELSDAVTLSKVAPNIQQCNRNANAALHQEAIANRLAALHEAVALCDTSLAQLRVDRIVYYSVAVFLTFLLVLFFEYSVPSGFKTLYLLLKFLVFGVILFCVFMASIWNFMERNGVRSGKTSMEIVIRNAEMFHLYSS